MEAKLGIGVAPTGLYSIMYPNLLPPALTPSSVCHSRALHDGLLPAYRIAAKWRARATSEAVHASEVTHSLLGTVPSISKVHYQTRKAEAVPDGSLPSTQSTPVNDSNKPAIDNRNSCHSSITLPGLPVARESRESTGAAPTGQRRRHHSPVPPRQPPASEHNHEQPQLPVESSTPLQPPPRSPHPSYQLKQQQQRKQKQKLGSGTRSEAPSHPHHSHAKGQPSPKSQTQSQTNSQTNSQTRPRRVTQNICRPSPPASAGQRPDEIINANWKGRTPKQITAALYGSTSLPHLLALLEVCGTLNAVQLCAAFTAAERIASREGSGGGGAAADGTPDTWRYDSAGGKTTGLLGPSCRPLTSSESRVLVAVLAAHSEVLADADPPELAVTLWAAARLRLRLPPAELGPAMEAIWMWDPADPTANRQEDRFQQRPPTGGVSGGARRDVIGPWEVCLLLYAVSVLWPEYVRQNAGGFLEALDSYESVGSYGGGGAVGLRCRRRGGGGLSCEQVAGVVSSLSRADAPLDEVEEEFVLQAVSSRLTAFSLPQLTALLSAAQKWSPLRRALHGSLLAAVLSRLDEHHERFMAARKERHGQASLKSRALPPPPPSPDGRGGGDGDGDGDSQAKRPIEASERLGNMTGGGGGGDGDEDDLAAADVARALVAVLRSGLDPTTGQPLPSRIVSSLMRQVRLRAATFNSRDVCEALRAMAALHKAPSFQTARVIRWKEGVRGLLRRWLELLRLEVAARQADKDSTGADGDTGTGRISGGRPTPAAAAAARTFATSLHAVAQLGIRLQPAETAAAELAALTLAPYMNHLADCVMVLSALPEVIGPEAAEVAEVAEGRPREVATTGVTDNVKVVAAMQGERRSDLVPKPGFEIRTEEEEAEEEEGEEEGEDGWLWLKGNGIRRLGPYGRRAAKVVLERAAVLLQDQSAAAAAPSTQGQGGSGGGGDGVASASGSAGELACLIRTAASVGVWPPEWWWRVWCEAVTAALPPALRPEVSTVTASAASSGGQAVSAWFSLTEAIDVLYSLARLVHLRNGAASISRAKGRPATRQSGGSRRWRFRWRWQGRRLAATLCCHRRVADAQTAVQPRPSEVSNNLRESDMAAAAKEEEEEEEEERAPLDGQLLAALLAVACLGLTQPRRKYSATHTSSVKGSGGGGEGGIGVMSVYFLSWAVARLGLFAPREVALWGPRLAAAAPRTLVRLTPRKQVLMLRSVTRAFRGAATPLPPAIAGAWLAAFDASMSRARGQTLSYAAAAMAAARISPPAPWLARFRAAVRSRVSELGVREIAALVAGLGLHRRQPQAQPCQQQLHVPSPLGPHRERLGRQQHPDANEWGNAGLARALLRVLRRKLAAAAAAATSQARGPASDVAADSTQGPWSLRQQQDLNSNSNHDLDPDQEPRPNAAPKTAQGPAQTLPPDTAAHGLARGASSLPASVHPQLLRQSMYRSPSHSHPSEAERQLVRRLIYLLVRGAAAGVAAGTAGSGDQLPPPAGSGGCWSGAQGEPPERAPSLPAGEPEARGVVGVQQVGTGAGANSDGSGGSSDSRRRAVALSPRPLLVIRRGVGDGDGAGRWR